MKLVTNNMIYGWVMAAGMALLFTACGSNNSSSAPAVGQCTTSGHIYTQQYGCLPQGGCASGQALYGNMCVAATASGSSCGSGLVYTYQGCMPQSAQCGANYGVYQNQCIPAMNVNGSGIVANVPNSGYGVGGTYGYTGGYVPQQYPNYPYGAYIPVPYGATGYGTTYNQMGYPTHMGNSGFSLGLGIGYGVSSIFR